MKKFVAYTAMGVVAVLISIVAVTEVYVLVTGKDKVCSSICKDEKGADSGKYLPFRDSCHCTWNPKYTVVPFAEAN